MATIEKTGKSWRVRRFYDGKLKTVATCATKQDAELILRRLEDEERARGRTVRGSVLPLSEVLVRWRKAKIGAGNDPLHTAAAEQKLRNLIAARNWASTSAVTALAVSDYRSAGGSPGACRFLAAVLRWARDTLDQHVDAKALLALRAGRPGRKPSPVLMSADAVREAEERAERMSASAGALIHCLATYGWRPITAARLTVADFDPFGGFITCRVKGGDVVRHMLLPATLARLRWLVTDAKQSEPLFRDPRTGQAWDLVGGISLWARNHLRIKVYDLKRYAISSMLARGVAPQDVAAFTGHRTISQVLRYSRSNEERQRAALDAISGKSVESPLNTTAHGDSKNTGNRGITGAS